MTFDRLEHRTKLNHAKSRIARALTEAGWLSYSRDSVEDLTNRAIQAFGPKRAGERTADYFNRVSGKMPKRSSSGQVALPNQFQPMQRREIESSRIPHLRQAEIDALPTPVSMPWDGHGNWTEGARW